MSTTTKSVNRKLLAFLQTGRDITANQARTRFGITNVSARMADLRAAGYPVYLNSKATNNGRTIKAYRLGTPNRKIIAAGTLALKDPQVAEFINSQLLENLARV